MALPDAYRVCLWSRLANRVLLEVGTFQVKSGDDLYQAAGQVRWTERLRPGGTLLVDFRGQSSQIKHSHFGALKIKDAIVDQFRNQGLERPSIDKEWPELRVQAYLRRDKLALYLDLAGDRKSTRLNSSHVRISYAVFCLKKKTNKTSQTSCS